MEKAGNWAVRNEQCVLFFCITLKKPNRKISYQWNDKFL